ncbi:putative Late embryogenesis abundant protein, LEA-14 [Lupinus albus]|uniref:Putative Late embryogenesis abundant protein, LEA-14 n=1 Tax=Lupinus albus TaxID=3870 RepID=A0A6A4P9R3_LUPAL|nr:putative Late embryogenesis abundant protein, LEA-14 [Lupinus albus]
MAELQRSTSKPAIMKDPSAGSIPKQSGRRVAFEAPSNNRYSGLCDIDSNIINHDKRRFNRCCSTFCVWSCLSLFILIIIFVFIAISYLILLQAGLPKINVRSLNITKLELDNNSQNLNAAIGLGIRITNKNEKTVILYGPLSVDVVSEDVPLGNAKVGRFSQEAQNETNLDLKMTMNNVMVDKDAVDSLKSDIDAKEMVFDVYVGGYIGFKIGNMHMTNVPFLSSCHEIKQMDVDFGRRPACDVRMFAFRPKSN